IIVVAGAVRVGACAVIEGCGGGGVATDHGRRGPRGALAAGRGSRRGEGSRGRRGDGELRVSGCWGGGGGAGGGGWPARRRGPAGWRPAARPGTPGQPGRRWSPRRSRRSPGRTGTAPAPRSAC